MERLPRRLRVRHRERCGGLPAGRVQVLSFFEKDGHALGVVEMQQKLNVQGEFYTIPSIESLLYKYNQAIAEMTKRTSVTNEELVKAKSMSDVQGESNKNEKKAEPWEEDSRGQGRREMWENNNLQQLLSSDKTELNRALVWRRLWPGKRNAMNKSMWRITSTVSGLINPQPSVDSIVNPLEGWLCTPSPSLGFLSN